MSTSPRVYLAGPDVFEPKPIERGERLKVKCTKYGLTGLFPLDNTISTSEPGSIAHAAAIRTANMELISSCDAILANMTPFRGPSMDVGTAYEMGVGAALGKVIVGYTTDGGKSYPEKVGKAQTVKRADDGHLRDRAGMSVEEFGAKEGGLVDNLMMSCGIEKLCMSDEEGLLAIAEILKARK
ncbi:uncharacterized protein L3040_009273 [Drepanopeziza brunnea f. sp. 'multigermtubi']|uniref:Nucleoside 2-deoxyribosyltransferase n=1 Tax=Marssonina brunnea f. sp. multigermtubi (strain MB_m1) TaxID=1072389 RepID=K1X2P9_MARBU|nr:nucleoside 2-deoxyribosyltransferase [Drepanopeziza brunnea f. sp. 'multigermtubi' MB_m1]EKD19287.1 nucleoside 2-deoxyribosyltransferase [Drepanopeziza brunnea f. sp. 'multigermtubi' MB_m1]KAJ5032678.1 hypothetical protein L3040_009273 [Drepanopeziza brunnea f. sp. 'multigermtubi']